MTVSVATSWQQLPQSVSGLVCVIDVLRWSSAVVTGLTNGADRVEAFDEPQAALARKQQLGTNALAVGERFALPIQGFDLGNSLREYAAATVQGKVLCSSTTNGTRALLAAAQAEWVLVGSFVNFGATAGAIASLMSQGLPVTLLAAGNSGEEALEDTACAGAFVDWLVTAPMLGERELDKSAKRARDLWIQHGRSPEQVFAAAPHANVLKGAGYHHDLQAAAQLNSSALIARAQGNVVQRATHIRRGQ